MHITASVFINDDEPGCITTTRSGWKSSRRSRPPPLHHNRTGEDNADAHLKRQIMGREVVVAITKGQAGLRAVGTDFLRRIRRPTAKRVLVKIIGSLATVITRTKTNRLEALSDGLIAILITIMVLELKASPIATFFAIMSIVLPNS